MSKLGFKFSWETEDTIENTTENNIQANIAEHILVNHILELNQKIQDCEEYIVSNEFSQLNMREKLQVLDTYQFYVKTFVMFNGESVMTDIPD